MKEFVVYTVLRLVLFVAALGVVLGIWSLVSDSNGVTPDRLFVSMIIAFVLSGVTSYFILNRQRDALARKVEARASRAAAKVEELRSKED